MLLSQCTDDVKLNITSYCNTISTLSNLSKVNKSFHTFIMHSDSGRKHWLNITSRFTGYDAGEHIRINAHNFHERVKLLCETRYSPEQ